MLPAPVNLAAELTVDAVNDARKALKQACDKWLTDLTCQHASRLPLIQGRLERTAEGELVNTALKLRHYLRIPVPAHRKALTRLYLSAHRLGIEVLRYGERYRDKMPREWRLCRFCHDAVESEAHALFGCTANPDLMELRRDFLQDIYKLLPDFPRVWGTIDAFLLALVHCHDFNVTQRLAKLTFEVFEVYGSMEIFKPAEYLYKPLE
ncbi:hypothetical protein C8R45DRAFT_888502 [Mycena sanguinolenta]|nr:hypothetical protein C8R45DRAFT_888502 [Mycena sanguinolenta]